MSATFASPSAFVAAATGGSIRQAWQSLSRFLAHRRARRHLAELPDYLLKDIGIGRSEIEPAVRDGRCPA
jgi:uncharacterized protein YjiS (DUF1127 family)